jgi:hypothetical protein
MNTISDQPEKGDSTKMNESEEHMLGLGNLARIMGQFRDIQTNMRDVQERAELIVEEASSGGGMVTARVNGKGQLVNVRIDPSLAHTDDTEMLEDLLVAAVNAANAKSQDRMKEELREAMGGLDLAGMEHLQKLLG